MRKLSATDVARHFSDVLDTVETERESFVVVRRGREVATISPASPATGAKLKALLERHRPDPAWRDDLSKLREGLVDEPAEWND